jgi:hypothetical protein
VASCRGHANAGCAGARDAAGHGYSPSQAEAFSCPKVALPGEAVNEAG